MIGERFELHQLTSAGNNLLFRARQCLASAPIEKVRKLADKVPSEITADGDCVKLVFCGQYSAGKSTIIKALTGREDIAIGAGITTETTNVYDWNGIIIVDTPGIHTQIRPDHDEIAYKAIADADLLVFVITNELFDSHLAEHFRKLAIERDKAHEMMLVVNKMMRCPGGNSKEVQKVIRDDVSRVLHPFTPEDLRITFIDAETALESREETDTEMAEALLRESGFDEFVRELNRFVREKGLPSKYTTALYNLEQILQEAITLANTESSKDRDMNTIENFLTQRRREVLEAKRSIEESVKNEIKKVSYEVVRKGHEIAEMIHSSARGEDIQQNLKSAEDFITNICSNLEETIQNIIANRIEILGKRLESIDTSKSALELFERIKRFELAYNSQGSSALKVAADISHNLGMFIVKNSFTLKAGSGFSALLKLKNYSGTKMHEIVKSVGKFLGKSFRPWEAVKITRGVATAGRVLGALGGIVSIALAIKEQMNKEKVEKKLREARAELRANFGEVAHEIEMKFDEATKSFIAEQLDSEIEKIDSRMEELRKFRAGQDKLCGDLLSLLKETQNLIKNIHKSVNYGSSQQFQ